MAGDTEFNSGVARLAKVNRVSLYMTITLVVSALASSVALMAKDAGTEALIRLPRGVISAAPLLLIGVSFLIAQLMLRPRWTDLLKNVLLAAAFLLWGAVQLMEQNALSKRLGNVVIVLYVLDIAWVILTSANTER